MKEFSNKRAIIYGLEHKSPVGEKGPNGEPASSGINAPFLRALQTCSF
jgi:hypothetical protein